MADKSNDFIEASLKLDDGRSYSGVVVNITNRGLVVVCSGLRDPEAMPGLRVSLRLTGAGMESAQEAPGHIQGVRNEDSTRHRLVVWVDDTADLDRLMSKGVSATFNRRGAYRVAPSAAEPIAVHLTPLSADWAHDDTAANLSASGVAVLVDQAKADKFQEAGTLVATLVLPGSPRKLAFTAQVRRAIPTEDGILIGLDFDPDRTDNFDDISDRIVDYIMRRQREVLREQRT